MAQPELYAFNSTEWDDEYNTVMHNQNPSELYPSLTPLSMIVRPKRVMLIDSGTSSECSNPEEYARIVGDVNEFATHESEMGKGQKAINQIIDFVYSLPVSATRLLPITIFSILRMPVIP